MCKKDIASLVIMQIGILTNVQINSKGGSQFFNNRVCWEVPKLFLVTINGLTVLKLCPKLTKEVQQPIESKK